MNTVLVVDDEPEIRSTLRHAFSGEGFDVQHAANGREAIDKYRQFPIDVVIADIQMPEMDGNEIVRRLRQMDEYVAAILLTADGGPGNCNETLRIDGVYSYLTKPLSNTNILIAVVNGAMENRRLRMENKALLSQLAAAGHRRKKERHTSPHSCEMLKQMDILELDSLYRSAPVGMCQIDTDHKFIKANAALTKMVDACPDELQGRFVEDVHPGLSRQLLPVCHRIYRTRKPILSYMISLTTEKQHGFPGFWLASSYPLILEDGSIAATSHFFQNISKLREAQEHIRLSKIMLQSVFDGISDPLVMVDHNFNVLILNRAAKIYHNLGAYKDMLGKKYDDLWLNSKDEERERIFQAVAEGHTGIYERPGQIDTDRTEKVTIYPMSRSATGLDGSIIQITDITEAKTIERRIMQNEKLASLGLLVSGVAHEINNPNTLITFNIPILKSYLKALLPQVSVEKRNSREKKWFGMTFSDFSDEIFKLIRNLEHGTHRITDIVENLRTLVKAKTAGKSRQPCNIADIVSRVDALCRSEIEKFVQTFEVYCPDDLPMVLSDAAALEQVMINLLINAAHAANKTDSKIKLSVVMEDDSMLNITVQDNGAGMDDETMKKIFDPFFTTKDPGLGTGLGLSVCHSLINAMDGTLEVKSVLDSGTMFRVGIPVRCTDEPDKADFTSTPDLTGEATHTVA